MRASRQPESAQIRTGRVALACHLPHVGMSFVSIVWLACGLAMDAAAVAAARGLAAPVLRARHVALIATFFGGFQALMPLLGWVFGRWLGPFVARFGPLVAFVLLGAIGAKMLWEGVRGGAQEALDEHALFAPRALLMLAIATSIDAFAAGFSLPLLGAPLGLSIVTIGVTTALLSVLGLYAGRRFGALLGHKLDAVGGVALLLLALRVLFQARA